MNKNSQECTSCQNLNKKLRVLQADYDFEIKKISEDKSTEKALYELNTNREIKKLQEKCLKQKQQRSKQNQLWMKKYDQLVERHKKQIQQYKTIKDKQLQEFKNQKQQETQRFKKDTLAKLQQRIQTLQIENKTMKNQLIQKYEKEICDLKAAHEKSIKNLMIKHEQNINKKSQQYEATILGIQSEKNVEQNLHRKTKQQSREAQTRLNQEIYILKRNIIDQEEKIIKLKTQIQQKCLKIENLHAEMLKKQKDHQQSYQQLSREYDQKFESHKKSMESKFQQLFKKELENCTKYEKALQKIEETRQMENQMYKANLDEIKGCVEERPSRLEDVEEIIKLREKFNKKQKQCESLSEQLKWYKLELENKQETYNKIFGPESKNNQSVFIRRKDMKMKRGGKSVTTVRQPLGSANTNPNILAPLIGNLQKKLLPPKQNRIL